MRRCRPVLGISHLLSKKVRFRRGIPFLLSLVRHSILAQPSEVFCASSPLVEVKALSLLTLPHVGFRKGSAPPWRAFRADCRAESGEFWGCCSLAERRESNGVLSLILVTGESSRTKSGLGMS